MSKPQQNEWNPPPPSYSTTRRPQRVPFLGNMSQQMPYWSPSFARGYNLVSRYQNPGNNTNYQPNYQWRNQTETTVYVPRNYSVHSNTPQTKNSKVQKEVTLNKKTESVKENVKVLSSSTELKFTENLTQKPTSENVTDTEKSHTESNLLPSECFKMENKTDVPIKPRLFTNNAPTIHKSQTCSLYFYCQMCDSKSETKQLAEEHSKLKNHKCKSLFKFLSQNDSNIKIKIIKNAFQCPECYKIYLSKNKMITHLIKSHSLKKQLNLDNYKNNINKSITLFLCHKCNLNNILNFYTTEKLYESHINNVHESSIKVALNHETEININNGLQSIITSETDILEILTSCICITEHIYVCPTCNKAFNEQIKLDLHCLNNYCIDNNNYTIDCNEKIDLPTKLIENKIIHFCPNCKFNALTKENVEIHIKTNHKIRLSSECIPIVKYASVFYCKLCQYNELNYHTCDENFKYHYVTNHGKINVTFKSEICNDIKKTYKKISTKNMLCNKNVLIYICKKCSYKSLNFHNVQIHVTNLHKDTNNNDTGLYVGIQNLDIYCCEICMLKCGEFNTFVSFNDLNMHLKLKHDDEIEGCDIVSK